MYRLKVVKNHVTNWLQYLCNNNSLTFMLDKTPIAQKEAHVVFTKTSIPLVASFKVGAYLFLIFLFDFFEFFCLSIVAPFMHFYLEKLESKNRWNACCPSWTPIIHSAPTQCCYPSSHARVSF